MNRMELVRETANYLKENDVSKPVSFPKQVFHISDDEGNKKDFIVRKTDKSVPFSNEDIKNILDAFVQVIEESLKNGETVSLPGFGALSVRYRKPRNTKHPDTGERVEIAGHYVPKFVAGKNLRICAKVYEMSLDDMTIDESHYVDDGEEYGD